MVKPWWSKRKNNTIDAKEPTGSRSELEREIESLKRNFFNIIDYGKQVKNDGVSYGSEIGDEFKTLIGDFKSDINPNIEKLQSHIENLQNRGEEISNTFQKIINKVLIIRLNCDTGVALNSLWIFRYSLY